MSIPSLKRLLIGEPFPTSYESHERLDNVRGLAVFASDPISSNAYATEAIMHVLVVLGTGALVMTLPIGLAVAALILLVVFSYVQTILHYPQGGGAYVVSKDNLGAFPSLIAAAALLTDYVLTVSVSVSAGVRAVTSAFPDLLEWRVPLALLAILLITWINLRGVRESGSIFSIPTYAFVAGVLVVIVIGLVRYYGWFGAPQIFPASHVYEAVEEHMGFAYIWLILRAFAGGCTALTGIEAISDGVKAFKPPESINAAKTMVAMGVIAMTLFLGITYLATHLELVPQTESILSQMTRQITGGGFLYYWVQVFTALILFLAANTGYQDFPRLSFFLARDNYMPRWLEGRGSRLVFSSGIILLAVLSSLIVIIFDADEIHMLPLYALGVMVGFTLSQSGMFILMGKIARLKKGESLMTEMTVVHYERRARWKQVLAGVGAVVTFLVLIVLVTTKFVEGAWIVVLLIPAMVLLFRSIRHHYENVSEALSLTGLSEERMTEVADVVLVPIADIHRGTLQALKYAKRLSKDVRAVVIATSDEMRDRLLMRWERFPNLTEGVQLVMIKYDYRDVLTPLSDYIERVNNKEFPDQITTVVIPEFIPENQAATFLHNQTAIWLQARLRRYEDIVIITVPYHINSQL